MPYSELHALGTRSPKLATDHDLATLGTALHDEAQDTIARPTDGKTIEQLVSQGLALRDGGQTTVLDLGSVEGDRVLWELEALLDERGEFANAASLLAEDFLCVCRADNDIGDGWSDADFDTGVTFLSEFALEELVQLGVENTVCRGCVLAIMFLLFQHTALGIRPFSNHAFSSIACPSLSCLSHSNCHPLEFRVPLWVLHTCDELSPLGAVIEKSALNSSTVKNAVTYIAPVCVAIVLD